MAAAIHVERLRGPRSKRSNYTTHHALGDHGFGVEGSDIIYARILAISGGTSQSSLDHFIADLIGSGHSKREALRLAYDFFQSNMQGYYPEGATADTWGGDYFWIGCWRWHPRHTHTSSDVD